MACFILELIIESLVEIIITQVRNCHRVFLKGKRDWIIISPWIRKERVTSSFHRNGYNNIIIIISRTVRNS